MCSKKQVSLAHIQPVNPSVHVVISMTGITIILSSFKNPHIFGLLSLGWFSPVLFGLIFLSISWFILVFFRSIWFSLALFSFSFLSLGWFSPALFNSVLWSFVWLSLTWFCFSLFSFAGVRPTIFNFMVWWRSKWAITSGKFIVIDKFFFCLSCFRISCRVKLLLYSMICCFRLCWRRMSWLYKFLWVRLPVCISLHKKLNI